MGSKIGFSSVNITPRRDNVPLGGYYVRYSTGVHDNITAKALYIATDNTEVILIACDLLGFFGQFVNRIRHAIEKYTQVPGKHILLTALHDHSAPDTIGLVSLSGFLKNNLATDWFDSIQKAIVKSAIEAKKTAKPGRLGLKSKPLDMTEKLVINRRHPARPLTYPLSVIKLVLEGNETGLVVNYACHGTTLNRDNRLISAEYPGYLRRKLEKELNLNFSMYVNGPCGDINPYLFPVEWDYETIDFSRYLEGEYGNYNALCSYKHTKRIGERLADHVIELSKDISVQEIESIKIFQKIIEIPVLYKFPNQKFTDFLLTLFIKQWLLKLLRRYNRSSVSYFNFIERDNRLFVQTELHLILINNELLIIGLPAEVFSEIGEELLQKSPFQDTLIISLANDWIGYIFPLKELQFGGYEVTGLPNLSGILAGTYIKNSVLQMFNKIRE
ncbi:MAG: neutral/alkaline non-lysosomal ceramidase N-terminal domain-containing protein [Candidatus Helarchaeota archaeon]